MSELTKRILVILVVFGSFAAVAYWFYQAETQRKPDIISLSRFDYIFSKDINLASSMANMPALREVSLDSDDIEVRIWRTHSTPTLEGVLLRRINNEWSGLHIRFRTNDQGDIQAAEVEQLKNSVSDWFYFWGKLVEKGLLLLPITAESECDTNYIDGILYVVEISQNNTYRNYQYREGDGCRESKQMTEIGEIIGLEFDSGTERCEMFNWFACMTERQDQSLTSPD